MPRHWTLFCASWIQSRPLHSVHPTQVLIMSYLLRLGLISSVLVIKIVYAFIISLVCSTCREFLILLDLITSTIFGEIHNLWSSSLCNFLPKFCNLPSLRLKYSSQHLYLKISDLFSYLRVTYCLVDLWIHVLYGYKTVLLQVDIDYRC
jgi:hypothetical protein